MVNLNIPYYAQWETPQLVDDFIHHRKESEDDPNWINSGALDQSEYAYWVWHICGMACLKMILDHRFSEQHKTIELAKLCMSYGGYKPVDADIEGLFYKPFTDFIGAEFSLNSTFFGTNLALETVKTEVQNGNYFILSVSQSIRDPEVTNPARKGGHLVLVNGVDDSDIFIHNPSGSYGSTQTNYSIKQDVFMNSFAERGILVYGENQITSTNSQ